VIAPTRRDFLRVMGSAAGGLALAFVLPGCGGPDPATAIRALKTGEFAPNAWLKITPDDRITFYLDRVEMGQGTMTSHVTLLAEELEVAPARVHVEHAPASRAYDNPDKDLGFQITGGSSSTRTSWRPLRVAGATAREMLKAAAAEAWGVAISEVAAEDGAVVHRASGRRKTYGQLARAAAQQPVPAPALKSPRDFKWIGKSVTRVDARAKVDGSAVYGIDVTLPGLLTAVILRPPVYGATLAGFDAAEAKRRPGVVDVFAVPAGVAVVAERYHQARAAAAHVQATWDEGAQAGLSTRWLWEQFEKRAKTPGKVVRKEGSFEKAAAEGKKTIEAVYRVPYLAHATMEPQNATAWVRADRCEIWAPTQAPALAVEEARRITGLPPEAITVHTTMIGGGFGRRLDQDFVAEALHVSKQLARPVKVVWSREDDIRHDHYRPMTYNVLRGAVGASGEVTAWFHHMVSQSIVAQIGEKWVSAMAPGAVPRGLLDFLGRNAAQMYRNNAVTDTSSIEGAADFAYAIPNQHVEYSVMAPAVPVGFWRAVGNSENVFIAESFLDELIHAAGKDPYEARRALLAGAPQNLRVLDLAAEKAGWGKPLPAGVARGIAQAKAFGSHCAQVAEVSVSGHHVRVHRVVAALDCGTVINPDLVRAQVESAVVFGLSAALRQEITFANGRVQQGNFHDFPALRMHEMPKIEVHLVPSDDPPRGVGEPGLPPVAPAVTNAIFAATGKRVRSLPIERALKEVSR
jgi:CO/xanthine dehydrogenase Mo-binding subunit